jgi:DNA repair exonuclease SbcCD ATPase subunit
MSKWLLPLVAALALTGGLAWLRQAGINAGQAARIEQLTAENRDLRARAERPTAPQTAAPSGPSRPVEHASAPRPSMREPFPATDDTGRLREGLAQAKTSISQLEGRIAELELQIHALNLDNKRLSGSEADLNENLAAANRLIDAIQKELKVKSDRLVQVEIDNTRLRDQQGSDTRKVAETLKLVTQLQDIHRRREVYLNNLLRRYKDLTDQYRIIEDRRQQDAGEADLSRIQSTIAMAEEDLRQINALNAQVLSLQKKIAGR